MSLHKRRDAERRRTRAHGDPVLPEDHPKPHTETCAELRYGSVSHLNLYPQFMSQLCRYTMDGMGMDFTIAVGWSFGNSGRLLFFFPQAFQRFAKEICIDISQEKLQVS